MVHTCNPSTRKEEAEGLGTQGHLQIQKEFEANLGYVILSQKKKKKQQIETKCIFRIRRTYTFSILRW